MSFCSLTLKPILRSWQSCEQPLSLLFRHSLMKQLSSSEPSPQSSLRSQSSVSLMHFPLLQAYAVPLHFFSVVHKNKRRTNEIKKKIRSKLRAFNVLNNTELKSVLSLLKLLHYLQKSLLGPRDNNNRHTRQTVQPKG